MIKKLLAKYKEIITYVLFGVLSTIVNFGAFYIFNLILGSSFYLATNIIAWFLPLRLLMSQINCGFSSQKAGRQKLLSRRFWALLRQDFSASELRKSG